MYPKYMAWVSYFLWLSPTAYFSLTPSNAIIRWLHQRLYPLIHSAPSAPIIFQWGIFPVHTVTDLNETSLDVCCSQKLSESARGSQVQTLLLHNSSTWERSPRLLHSDYRPSQEPGRWEEMRYHQSKWLLAAHGALGLSFIPGDKSAVKLLPPTSALMRSLKWAKFLSVVESTEGITPGPAAQNSSLAISPQPAV